MQTPRTALALGALTTALLLVLSGALGGSASAAESPTGWIRVGHLSPDTPKAEVTLTPFAGGEATTLGEAEFGDLSDYTRVPVGLYTLSLAEAGQDGPSMLSSNVEITEDSARTVVATGDAAAVRATVLDDDLTPPAGGEARVRLVSAVTQSDAVDAEVVDGPVLAQELAAGAATGYADVAAQEWQVRLSATASEEVSESVVPVEAGAVYTLVALDAPGGGLQLRAVMDSSGSASGPGADGDRGPAGVMPSGGVDTGAGGLATPQSSASVQLLVGGSLLALVAGGAALAARRRGPV